MDVCVSDDVIEKVLIICSVICSFSQLRSVVLPIQGCHHPACLRQVPCVRRWGRSRLQGCSDEPAAAQGINQTDKVLL